MRRDHDRRHRARGRRQHHHGRARAAAGRNGELRAGRGAGRQYRRPRRRVWRRRRTVAGRAPSRCRGAGGARFRRSGRAEGLSRAPGRAAGDGRRIGGGILGRGLGPRANPNCNAPALAAMCALAGAEVAWTGTAADEPSALGQRVEEALAAGDVLVLSGGVSKGRFDFVPEVLAERGGAVFFHGVRIRPGRPVVFGKVRERLFFGLPGNPLSAMLTFELFVRPALALLAGAAMASVSRPYFTAEMGFEYRGRALPLELFLPVRFEGDLRRARVARVSYHGSADVVAWAAADGYLAVPEGTSELAAGSAVSVLPK